MSKSGSAVKGTVGLVVDGGSWVGGKFDREKAQCEACAKSYEALRAERARKRLEIYSKSLALRQKARVQADEAISEVTALRRSWP